LLVGLLVVSSMLLRTSTATAADSHGIDNPFFQATWDRTDALVAGGAVARTWVWGTAVSGPLGEAYDESPGGERLVQYFDKSRMEISDPDHDPADVWYVTNGLLARELITGRMQLGDDDWVERAPAEVNIAGDADDPDGPTYASFAGHLDDAPAAEGDPVEATIDRAGDTGCCVPDSYGVTAGPLVVETGHRVASVFWDYLNSGGKIIERGRRTTGPLFANPFYATGYPIGEPYWALVRVAGIQQWVLVQPFERRVMTFTPDNDPAWRVEMGNVGQHYYTWRYAPDFALDSAPEWTLPSLPTDVPDGQMVEIPDLDLHYDLHISSVDVDTGEVVAGETIEVNGAGGPLPDVLYLQEVPAEYGYFELDSLTVGGEPVDVTPSYDGTILGVDLPDGLAPPFDIDVNFQLHVGTYPNDFIGTVLDDGALRLGYWFPIVSDSHGYSETLDPSESRTADFDVTVDVAPDVVVAHTGAGSVETLDDGRDRYSLSATNVRDFALVFSPAFDVRSEVDSVTGVEVRVYSLPGSTDAEIDAILATGMDAVRQLSDLLGPYPYPQLSYVDVGPNMPGGLEFPNLIYITTGYDPLDRLIYHETAHQWMYGIIGNRTVLDGWIDEGSAEFFERGLPTGFTENASPPPGGYLYALDSTYLELPYDSSRQWYYSIYEQGCRFWHELLDAMGWDAFWSAWRAVYNTYAFDIVTPWEMLATFQENSPTDLRPIFDDYFRYAWIWELLPPGG